MLKVPFGVNYLWDPSASVAIAAATGARFVREIFTGALRLRHGLVAGRLRRRLARCAAISAAMTEAPLQHQRRIRRTRSTAADRLAREKRRLLVARRRRSWSRAP